MFMLIFNVYTEIDWDQLWCTMLSFNYRISMLSIRPKSDFWFGVDENNSFSSKFLHKNRNSSMSIKKKRLKKYLPKL